MKGRRPGSKGNEWLMIKKHDEYAVEGYDAGDIDESVLSGRSLAEIAGDAGSAEWKSRPAGRGKLKAAWLADAVAKLDQKKKQKRLTTEDTGERRGKQQKKIKAEGGEAATSPTKASEDKTGKSSVSSVASVVKEVS